MSVVGVALSVASVSNRQFASYSFYFSFYKVILQIENSSTKLLKFYV